ncbi:polyamine aminopropyltransferase [Aureibacillus halotolerans]|nr:polyamine aminopropyltransferase [Aureibacillus halotolerans]
MISPGRQVNSLYWASGIVSICGIIFEVLFGALGSYILGDGVKQYTLTISLFLTGMGIGAAISEKVTKNLILSFVWIEYAIGLIGGFSAFILFGVTAYLPGGTDALVLYGITLIVGTFTGVELPVLIRKANEIGVSLSRSTARVLFSDYAGGLAGGLLFVFLLRPQFGLVKTPFLVALVNVGIALWILWLFRSQIKHFKIHAFFGIFFLIILIVGVLFGEQTAFRFEQRLYQDTIVHAEETAYQRIIITRNGGDTRLYLNGQLQLSSVDEHRYHEALIHPAMSAAEKREKVLILGGGDGAALREILKYDDVKDVTLVDLDPRVVQLAKTNHFLLDINQRSLFSPKVDVLHQDAFQFLESHKGFFDVIIIDLPDPNNEALNKLYTFEFYSLVRNHLSPGGTMEVQATSPVFAREAYWTINKTIQSTGLHTLNLHVDVPSFGNWGFVLASREEITEDEMSVMVETDFLTNDVLSALTAFGKDEGPPKEDVEVNTLINPLLLELYESSWKFY